MKKHSSPVLDVVGVGIGPFNLSTAALLDPVRDLKCRFYERKKEFQWHPGLLIPEATIQVSFLKDLVTLVDPTNAYSFLAFLAAQKRLYRFINANFARVSRLEFNQYFQWVASQLPSLEFGREVQWISWDGDCFVVEVGAESIRTRNVILGTGLQEVIPECASPHLGESVFHASSYLHQIPRKNGTRIAVVGGGQTGAEIVHHLLSQHGDPPTTVIWISRRPNFLPLDESPFTNELFTPSYSDYFYDLPPEEKTLMLAEQKLASDGIDQSLLERIYQQLYESEFLNGCARRCSLHNGLELAEMRRSPSEAWTLVLRDRLNYSLKTVEADTVILATGSTYKPLRALEPIMDRLSRGQNGFVVRDDYSIEWDGPSSRKIYVQNGAKHYFGIADPNLSLMAWRSATIINSLAEQCIYGEAMDISVFDRSTTRPNERRKVENECKRVIHITEA